MALREAGIETEGLQVVRNGANAEESAHVWMERLTIGS